MAKPKKYGENVIGEKPPLPIKVKVLIQQMQGTKSLQGKTFTVYGAYFEDVIESIETVLRDEFDV